MTSEHMYSAEEAARLLGLQVRTVRNYVREGRLPGVRIGKQYRIARADLELFTAGGAAREPDTEALAPGGSQSPRTTRAEVSSVVEVDGLDLSARDTLERTIEAAVAAARGAQPGSGFRAEPLYDEERQRLKVIVVGGLEETAELLRIIGLFALDRG